MATSEEQESKQRNANTHTEEFHVSALVISLNILLTKVNDMVKHRIKGQGNELYLSTGRTSKTDDKGNGYTEGRRAGGVNAIHFTWVQFHASASLPVRTEVCFTCLKISLEVSKEMKSITPL